MLSKIFGTVKYLLLITNFLFLITGIIVLSVGSSVQSAYNGYHQFLSDRFFSLPAFCIATGVIIILIGFIGFYGAYTENHRVILAYVFAMILMFVFQLSTCIAGYTLRSSTVALVQQQLHNTMQLYKDDFVVQQVWDEVQYDFSCCGVTNASDWLGPLDTATEGSLPLSCCPHEIGSVGTATCTINTSTVYKNGCSDAFGNWVKEHAGSIGVAGVFLVLIQALVVGAALWMAKVSREEQSAYP
ncbi:CD63 antigen-like [Galleria mellonella]|uniref:Tetraspanin n=1 Tax=Galleria mellonella TaxID=7137 RepID=A0A6J1WRB0_GALME|nr:CD63 antigen-like [Galleria mellonella]